MQENDVVTMKKSKDGGFSLVELLIVIVILGILATVTVFAVRGVTTDAVTNACEAEEKVLQTAAQTYFAEHTELSAIPLPVFDTLVSTGLLASAPTTHTMDGQGNPTGIGDCV